MNNRVLLAVLAGLYPVVFFSSSNWYVFPFGQFVFLIFLISLFSSVLLMSIFKLFSFSLPVLTKNKFKKEKNESLLNAFHGFTAICFCVLLLFNNLIFIPFSPPIKRLIVGSVIVFTPFYCYRNGLKQINALLILLTSLSFIQWGVNVTSYDGDNKWNEVNRSFNEKIQLTKKPNVYYILTESYPNKDALNDIFGFSNSEFYNDMESRNFFLYHKMFGNYCPTLASISSVFSMEHHYYSVASGNDDSLSARNIIKNERYNSVLDVFQRNGYGIQYMHQSNWQLLGSEPMVDYYWPPKSNLNILYTYLDNRAFRFKHFFNTHRIGNFEDLFEIIVKRADVVAKSDQPYFSYIYLSSPDHSPHNLNWANEEKESQEIMANFRATHQANVLSANEQILRLIDLITSKDKNALIIVSGDHGSYGYRAPDAESMVSQKTLTLDKLGILFAIRFPDDHHISEDDFKSKINLFRHIFDYLSDSNKVMATKVSDDSYLRIGYESMVPTEGTNALHAVKDGFILETPRHLE